MALSGHPVCTAECADIRTDRQPPALSVMLFQFGYALDRSSVRAAIISARDQILFRQSNLYGVVSIVDHVHSFKQCLAIFRHHQTWIACHEAAAMEHCLPPPRPPCVYRKPYPR